MNAVVEARMDEICAAAQSRIDAAAYAPGIQYAAILWMTPDEAGEFLTLRNQLPSSGLLAADARQRITEKIALRSRNRHVPLRLAA